MPSLTDLAPANETERLYALHQAAILDVVQEDVFEELVALSARLFGLPVAYLTLLDADRLHYKASHGWPLPAPAPRQDVLCAQVVRQNRVVLYHDLTTAPRTALDGPAIAHALTQQARFYAGAPLRTAAAHAIGTLCLIGRQPRAFSPQEQHVFEQLAALVAQVITVRQHCLGTPALGPARWQRMHEQVHEEVCALGTLVRYLLQRYGALEPVPDDVLYLLERRLQEVQALVGEGMGAD